MSGSLPIDKDGGRKFAPKRREPEKYSRGGMEIKDSPITERKTLHSGSTKGTLVLLFSVLKMGTYSFRCLNPQLHQHLLS